MSTTAVAWPAAPLTVGVGDVLDLADVPVPDREVRLEEMVSATHVDMAVRLGPDWPAASFRARVRRRRIEDLVGKAPPTDARTRAFAAWSPFQRS